jgi:galactokinase
MIDFFEKTFGQKPLIHSSAPGRVNLIGEHTDYNGGFVLPMAIPQTTEVYLNVKKNEQVQIASANFPKEKHEYKLGNETREGKWTDYIKGVTKILREQGHSLTGFQVTVESSVPIGAGLSSSAALEVSMMRALRQAFHLKMEDRELALNCQQVENNFVGAHVGVMDPMACNLADLGTALFIDTRDLSYRKVRLPLEQIEFIVIHSGITHSNVGGEYNERRAQCEKAAALLGVKELRDITVEELNQLEKLPEPLKRRARHVITENARVLEAVSALEKKDLQKLGILLNESHTSLRTDYEVSLPQIDLMVELARRQPGCLGARITGGGFGGSIVVLAKRESAIEISRTVSRVYSQKTGHRAVILVP